jgi:hypothetical protein
LPKSSYVLQALKILGLEEMLKLSEVLHMKQAPLKKVAGEDLIIWDTAPAKEPVKKEAKEAQVLNFPKRPPSESNQVSSEVKEEDEEVPGLIHSEIVLWQREVARQTSDIVHRLDAYKGYTQSTVMYVVKEPATDGGPDKNRLAATSGVLVNKKQA